MFQPQQTDVLVLAGGLGTRLRAVVSDRPKPMAAIHGRPFISYLLDQIAAAGFGRVIFCVGHRAEQVETLLGPIPKTLQIVFSREERQLGTAGALGLAAPLMHSERALVLNGDSYIDVDLVQFGAWADRGPFEAALIAVHVDDARRYGTLELARDGRVIAFREKEGRAEPGWINAGAYVLPRTLISTIPSDGPRSLETDIFPDWVMRGALGAWCIRERFIDIGTPESYAAASEFFAAERAG